MLTNYEWLKSQLEAIERRVSPPKAMNFAGASEIRHNQEHRGTIQTVVIDYKTRTANTELPVIIAIDSNYTQEPTEVPRCDLRPFCVEDTSTGACRTNLLRGIEHFSSNRKCWADVGMAAHEQLRLPQVKCGTDFHFVMSNFCLWITNTTWTKIKPTLVQHQLLQNNPLFDHAPNPASSALHLVELARVMKGREVLWVAHVSANEQLSCLFKAFARTHAITNWLLMPNLSHGQNFERLSLIKQYRAQFKG